jgi:hypothetical protein
MPTMKPSYSSRSADFAGTSFATLSTAAVGTSNAVDNSSALYQDYLIEAYVDGTAAATAWMDFRLAPSENGTDFGTWESAIPLGVVDLSVDLQRAFFSLCGHGGLFQAPQYFRILGKNNTGANVAVALRWQGINIVSV